MKAVELTKTQLKVVEYLQHVSHLDGGVKPFHPSALVPRLCKITTVAALWRKGALEIVGGPLLEHYDGNYPRWEGLQWINLRLDHSDTLLRLTEFGAVIEHDGVLFDG